MVVLLCSLFITMRLDRHIQTVRQEEEGLMLIEDNYRETSIYRNPTRQEFVRTRKICDGIGNSKSGADSLAST